MTTRVKNSSESSSSDSPLAARVHALIAQWRETSAETREHHDMSKRPSLVRLPKHSERTIATLRRCADELEDALEAALAAAQPEPCVCGEADGMAVYSADCPNELHAKRARKIAALAAALAPTSDPTPSLVDLYLKRELTTYLDRLIITSENIGDIRRQFFVPWESAWNGIVREETASRELPAAALAPQPEKAE